MTLRVARTNAEAHLYMSLAACESCGESGFTSQSSSVIEVDGDLASRYVGPCPHCGEQREFVFRIPQEVILPDPRQPSFGSEHPSELIDAGQWVWYADRLTSSSPAQPTPDLTEAERRRIRTALRRAAAAMAEAGKFAAPDAESVPREALWTELGQAVYDREPGRFSLRRLEVVRSTYDDVADRFDD